MRKKAILSQTEKDLFHAAVRDVKPLSTRKKILPAIKKVQRKPKLAEEAVPNYFQFSDALELPAVTRQEKLSFSRSGLQHKVLRKLRLGQYNIDAVLDLHGMNIVEARETVGEFLLQCQENHYRCILIVHGKGYGSTANQPILKNKLNSWLRQTKQVLGFCSAAAKDGGTGAVYVLLKIT